MPYTHTVTVRTKSGRYHVAPGMPSGHMFDISDEVQATLEPGDKIVETCSFPEEITEMLPPDGFFSSPFDGIRIEDWQE